MAEQDLNERFDVREAENTASGVTTLELSGQLDAHTAPIFERFLEERVRGRGKQKLVLDFAKLDYISSAGLGVLLRAHKKAMAEGGKLRLVKVNHHIFDIFRYSGFDQLFEVERQA